MNASDWLMFAIICLLNAVVTRILLRNLNYFLMSRGIYGIDVNKPSRNKIPEEGGVSLCIAFVFSGWLFSFIWDLNWVIPILIATALICLVGFVDHFRNIRPVPKLFYGFAIGLLYYLIIMESTGLLLWQQALYLLFIGVAFTIGTNAFNLLAGFNGIESGVTVISSGALTIYYYMVGFEEAAALLILLNITYLVIWQLNRFPAQIFLGDSGTLMPVSVYIGIAVYTGHWWPLPFVLAPHFLNAFIKFLSTGISTRSDYAPLVYQNEKLQLPEKNYWSLIRLYIAAAGPRTEPQIVNFVFVTEFVACAAMLLILLGR